MIFSSLSRSLFFKKPIALTYIPKRFFDLHEYQSKQIMRQYGINVQKGELAKTPEHAAEIASKLSNKGGLILKAQVHAGGRGKGHLTSGLKGGVQICKTPEEIKNYTKQMIGYNLITKQTTKNGLPVSSVLVHEGVDIDKQLYLAIMMDRQHDGPVFIASKNGGMDIEEVAKNDPNSIKVIPVSITKGLDKTKASEIADKLELDADLREKAIDQLIKLYDAFIKLDATIIEVNPWAVTPERDLYCVDAKVTIDESSLFRHKDIVDMKKDSASSEEVDPNEEKASSAGLNYIGLDGNIGCMVNGAGLAMATMDIIKDKGGEPANFLDVGGSASVDQVKSAFELLTSHKQVKAILINIFGGIMRCDVIAEGIIKAAEQIDIKVPLIVRLTGTNAEKGRNLLKEYTEKNSGKFNIQVAANLDEAATKAVSSIKH